MSAFLAWVAQSEGPNRGILFQNCGGCLRDRTRAEGVTLENFVDSIQLDFLT